MDVAEFPGLKVVRETGRGELVSSLSRGYNSGVDREILGYYS